MLNLFGLSGIIIFPTVIYTHKKWNEHVMLEDFYDIFLVLIRK